MKLSQYDSEPKFSIQVGFRYSWYSSGFLSLKEIYDQYNYLHGTVRREVEIFLHGKKFVGIHPWASIPPLTSYDDFISRVSYWLIRKNLYHLETKVLQLALEKER